MSDYVLAGYGTEAPLWPFLPMTRATMRLPAISIFRWCRFIEGADVSEESFDAKEGKMINSANDKLNLNGLEVKEAIARTKEFIEAEGIGRVKVNYRLRDAIFSRQRYWGEPFPVYYKDGVAHIMDESVPPLMLPEVDSYLPTATGGASAG